MTEYPILPEEAQEALKIVEQTVRQMRRAVVRGGMPHFLLLWGVVWVLGFGSTHFLGPESPQARTVWLVLTVSAITVSMLIGWRLSDRVRSVCFPGRV